jgi:hypothetical protein
MSKAARKDKCGFKTGDKYFFSQADARTSTAMPKPPRV